MKTHLYLETLFAVIAIILIIIALSLEFFLGTIPFVITMFGVAFLIGGFYKAKVGLKDTLEQKRLNVEFLMIVAAIAAFLIGNYSEAVILILIFSISGVLESFANAKSEKALKALLNLAPQKALLYENNSEKEVPLELVKEGQILIVKVGQKVPVDGVITEGSTAVDQAAITGEFVPAYKHKGDKVYAGAINLEASFLMQASKNAKDSVIQKIVAFVEKAQTEFPQSETKIKHFERYYVYIVIGLALSMMFIPPIFNLLPLSEAINRGIIVLVVGSPCALVASVSPAVLSALSNASKQHVLIKGGSKLETLNTIGAVIFDKTGTITTGEPQVVKMDYIKEDDPIEAIIYTLEKQSNHPLAKAICKYLVSSTIIECISTKEKPGYGIEAVIDGVVWQIGRFEASISQDFQKKLYAVNEEGLSTVHIIKDGHLLGYIALKDTLRESVKPMIQTLKERNIYTIMMTGDNEQTALNLGKSIGVDTVHSECYPEDKVSILERAQKEYGKVMMIGDGINDAPALALSDVAIAMGTGTDVSLETSDIVFIDDNLGNLVKVFDLAKSLKGIIRINILLSVSVIALLMIGNFFGQINLPFGVFVHELSTIVVILNSLRLLFK